MNKEIKIYIIAGAISLLGVFGNKILGVFNTGAEVEFKQKIESIVTKSTVIQDSTIKMMLNPKILSRVLETDIINRFSEETAKNVEKAVAQRIMRKDTANQGTSLRGFVGVEADIRTEKVLPVIAQLVKAWYNGEIILKKDINKYIKAEVKREVKRLREVPKGTEIN